MTMVFNNTPMTAEEKRYFTDLGEALKAVTFNPNMMTPSKKMCMSVACRVKLCEYLDAYYGKAPDGHRHCAKCRRKKGIT
jgi:hypothetical protein